MAFPSMTGEKPQPSRMVRISGFGLGTRRPSDRLTERAGSREMRGASQLFLDAKELVVFRDPVGAAGRAGLDLARGGRHREIGDERVFGLTGTMRDHRRVA